MFKFNDVNVKKLFLKYSFNNANMGIKTIDFCKLSLPPKDILALFAKQDLFFKVSLWILNLSTNQKPKNTVKM